MMVDIVAAATEPGSGVTSEIDGRSELRAEFAELVRRRISEAALKLFTTSGYRATTVRQIAAVAGTTHTTLYKYFNSKEALIFGLLDEIAPAVAGFYARVGQLVGRPELFDRWFDEYADFWVVHRAIYHAFWEAALANPEIAGRTSRTATALIKTNSTYANGGRRFNDVQTKRLALWLLGVDNLLSVAYMTGDEKPADSTRADLRLLLRAAFMAIFADCEGAASNVPAPARKRRARSSR